MIFLYFLDRRFQTLEMYVQDKPSLPCIKIALSSTGESGRDLHNSDSSILAEMNTFLFIIHQSHHRFISCKGLSIVILEDSYRQDIHKAFFKSIIGCDLKEIIRSHCPKISSSTLGPEFPITGHRI